ncbi:hypothetical protein AB0L65_32980 [Nonomuraea sp. NPDC052116]|uniref:hypothetical protein n=1 Tax=Nonomuraea sp. NPDC052116 TaxID=3155665 RepID=UPI003414DAB7
MPDDRLPNHLLVKGYASERTRVTELLRQELRDATSTLEKLTTDLTGDDTATTFSGTAAKLGRTVADLIAYAAALDMANRLAFLCPSEPEEG